MNPLALAALRQALEEPRSALPDAPVIPERYRAPGRRTIAVRLAMAGALRRAADRLEAGARRITYG
jgi:hypothetical protein